VLPEYLEHQSKLIDEALSETLNCIPLFRTPISIPGREIVQVITEIQAGAESGWHMHPGEEVGYIFAGTVELTIEGRPTVALQAGDSFLVPPRTSHSARNIGPETARVIATYIVDQWEPLAWYSRLTMTSSRSTARFMGYGREGPAPERRCGEPAGGPS